MTVFNKVAPGAYGVGLLLVNLAVSPVHRGCPYPTLNASDLICSGEVFASNLHTNLSQVLSCLYLTSNTYYKVSALFE